LFYLQTARAPVVITAGGDLLSVPRFTRGEFKEWAAEVAAQNAEAVTQGLDAVRRAEYLTFYTNYGLDVFDLRKLVRTDEGAWRVCRACLLKATVKDAKTGAERPAKTEAEVDTLLEANSIGARASLAWVLSDLEDTSLTTAPAQQQQQQAGGDEADPSKRSGTPS